MKRPTREGNVLLGAAWIEAEAHPGKPVDIGRIVVCDSCSADYTDSAECGGFIFCSYGYCPTCARRMLPRIEACRETRNIEARCPEGQAFADFVREYRGTNTSITIHKVPL